jgi:hypothetical protein
MVYIVVVFIRCCVVVWLYLSKKQKKQKALKTGFCFFR